MQFFTEHCYVSCFKESDIDKFMEYRNNLEWMKYQSFKGLSKEEYKKSLIKEQTIYKGIQLGIFLKDTRELIGDLYLYREENICWIGYTINPKNARKGYAYEVTSVLIDLLAKEGVEVIKAGVEIENTASVNLLKKLNFTFEEILDGEHISYNAYKILH